MTNCRASPWPSSREPLRLCYGCISGLPPSQLQPLQIDGGNCHLICCKIRRKSKQTLADVLNHCQAALQHGRYNTQHDRFLDILFTNLQLHLPPGTKVVADLAGQPYTLPGSLLADLKPDLVVHSPGQLHLLELTVCWEANFVSAKLRKESKYLHLLEQAHSVGTQAALCTTIQVGCRGFIDSKSLHHLIALAPTSIKVQKSLTSQIKTAIEESHAIWSL